MSYTKGPYKRIDWRVFDRNNGIIADFDLSICNLSLDEKTITDNARLFEAGPDLVEALGAIEVEYREVMGVSLTENYSSKRDKRHQEQYRKVYEALTKAKGGQP